MENVTLLSNEPQVTKIKLPLVTVITAVYNAEKYIEECILSVLGQTYDRFEYILIDGGSTDKTVDIIKRYQGKVAYWVSEPDNGIYDAWNKAVLASKGAWLVFVGADDVLYPDAIQKYITHITEHPRQHELDFVSSQIELVKDDLAPIRIVGEAWQWDLFRTNMITWHVGCFHAKHLFDRYGMFDPSYKICGDYELLMRPKDKLVTSYIAQTTVKMRAGGVSNVSLSQAIDETYRAKIKNGIVNPVEGNIFRIIDKVRIYVREKYGL